MISRTVNIPSEVIAKNRTRGRFGNLQYPSDGGTHGIYMEFKDYDYRGGAVAGVNKSGSIGLPLPENISDSLDINVGPKELGVLGAGLADVVSGSPVDLVKDALAGAFGAGMEAGDMAKTAMSGDFSGVTGALSTGASYAAYIAKAGLGSLVGGFGDAISSATGTAVNPHATLVFDGVTMKNFSFTWKLAPSNEIESNQIHAIIRTIQSKSLPKYQSVGGAGGTSSFSRGILEYPSMVDMYFVGIDPDKIFRFKRSMIRQVSVDYSGSGGNVMIRGNRGSAPAFINLSVQFVESEIWTQEDYDRADLSRSAL